jgi:hypothetical protein
VRHYPYWYHPYYVSPGRYYYYGPGAGHCSHQFVGRALLLRTSVSVVA